MPALDDRDGLFDRGSVLREIDALVREAKARGSAVIVRVTGPPGIGKSAVLRAYAGSRPASRFVTAEASRQTDAGHLARLLCAPGGDDGDVPSEDAQLPIRVRAALRDLDVVVLDDAQWADEPSVAALTAALATTPGLAVLVGDRRTEAPEWPAHETVTLAPLHRAAAVELVRRVHPAIVPAVAARIADLADGLPFAVLVLASDAATRDVATADAAAPSVTAVLARRLTRLAPLARRLAEFLSLADPPAALALLADGLGTTLDDVASSTAELGDLVTVENGAVAFRHDMLRAAVAELVPNAVAVYARLLAAYEARGGPAAAIVRCALACGQPERAASAALELARALARDGALGSALHYAEIAFRNAPRPVSVDYTVEYAVLLQLLARDDEAASLLRQAVRAAIGAGDAAAAADLLAALFNPAVTLERFAEVEALCDRIEALRDCTTTVAERVRTVRLASLAYAGRLDEYERIMANVPGRSWVDARTAAFVSALRGDPSRAASEADTYTAGLEARHARQESPDRILERVLTFYFRGTRALDPLEALPETDVRYPSESALRALARICEGRWDQARALLDGHRRGDSPPFLIVEMRTLLDGLRRDPAPDEPSLRAIRALIAQRQIRHAVTCARWYAVASGAAAPADVASFVRDTLDVPPMPDSLSAPALATALLRDVLGREQCAAAIERYPVFETPWHRAHALLASGLAGDSHEQLRSARAMFEELSCPVFATLAGIALPAPRSRDLATARALGLVPAAPEPLLSLTARERAIAERVARGASNHAIAAALSISVRTVETHLTNVYAKLGVPSRSALAAMMHEHDV